jgi:hypothetical protein
VVGGLDLTQGVRAQGGDCHGERVIGIVLVRATCAEHSDPRGQRRRDIDDVLTGIDELLG